MAKLGMAGMHQGPMIAKWTARDIHLAKTAQVAGEAFGYHAAADGEAAGWRKPALALLFLSFLGSAAYFVF